MLNMVQWGHNRVPVLISINTLSDLPLKYMVGILKMTAATDNTMKQKRRTEL